MDEQSRDASLRMCLRRGERAEGVSHLNPKVPIMTFHQLWGFGKVTAKIVAKIYGVDYYEMYPAERSRCRTSSKSL